MADLMRLNIDGKWTVNEFADALQAIQQLYDFHTYCRWLSRTEQGRPRSRHLHRLMDMMDLDPMEADIFLRFSFPNWHETDATLESISTTMSRVRETLDSPEMEEFGFASHLEGPVDVARINYSSPGITDIAGVGEIIGHIKDFILSVIEMRLNSEHRNQVARKLKIENDRSEIEMIQVRIETVDRFIDVARKAGFSKKQIRTASLSVDDKVDMLAGLVDMGKLTSVEIIDEETAAERG
ncbi:MAG: hypothetical protein IID44_02525 [Planctomycetes bacterium]|nr:hypothetical protein [Planctomycetota bacterium]